MPLARINGKAVADPTRLSPQRRLPYAVGTHHGFRAKAQPTGAMWSTGARPRPSSTASGLRLEEFATRPAGRLAAFGGGRNQPSPTFPRLNSGIAPTHIFEIQGDRPLLRGHRLQILWQIEHKLAEEDARPIIFYADGGTCMRPKSRARWRSAAAGAMPATTAQRLRC